MERRASLGVAALEKLGGTLGVRRASQVASAVNHQGARSDQLLIPSPEISIKPNAEHWSVFLLDFDPCLFQFLGHGWRYSELSEGARRRWCVQQAAEEKRGKGGRVHSQGGWRHSSQSGGSQVHESTNIGRFNLLLLPGPARCPRSCSWTKNVSFSVTQTCNH